MPNDYPLNSKIQTLHLNLAIFAFYQISFMNTDQITYLVFGIILITALIFDLGLLSKKGQKVTIRQALYQTFFWVGLALAFCVFMWIENGENPHLNT